MASIELRSLANSLKLFNFKFDFELRQRRAHEMNQLAQLHHEVRKVKWRFEDEDRARAARFANKP